MISIHQALSIVKKYYPEPNKLKIRSNAATFCAPWREDRHPSASLFLARDGKTWILKDHGTGEMMTLKALDKVGIWKGHLPDEKNFRKPKNIPIPVFPERPEPYPVPEKLLPSEHMAKAIGEHEPHDFTQVEDGTIWYLRPADDFTAPPVNATKRVDSTGAYYRLGPSYPSAWVSPIPEKPKRILIVEGMTSATAVWSLLQSSNRKIHRNTIVIGIPGKNSNTDHLALGAYFLAEKFDIKEIYMILDQDAEDDIRSRWQFLVSPIPIYHATWHNAAAVINPAAVNYMDGYDIAYNTQPNKVERFPSWITRKVKDPTRRYQVYRHTVINEMLKVVGFDADAYFSKFITGLAVPSKEDYFRYLRNPGKRFRMDTYMGVFYALLQLARSSKTLDHKRWVPVQATMALLVWMSSHSKDHVRKALRDFEKHGVIRIEQTAPGFPNIYWVNIQALHAWRFYLPNKSSNLSEKVIIWGPVSPAKQILYRWRNIYGFKWVHRKLGVGEKMIYTAILEVEHYRKNAKKMIDEWNKRNVREGMERYEALLGRAQNGDGIAKLILGRMKQYRQFFSEGYQAALKGEHTPELLSLVIAASLSMAWWASVRLDV